MNDGGQVTGHHGQVVNLGGGRDHGVLDEIVGPSIHEPRPSAEDLRVHAQDIVGLGDLLQPSLDLGRLGFIPLAGHL
jgi:hypothetical protein